MTREEAIKTLKRYGGLFPDANGEDEAIDMAIEALQTDTVEIVRCKDCKYSQIFNGLLLCTRYYGMGHDLQETDFCSYGERNEK